MNVQYNGRHNGTTERLTLSDSRGLAPTLYANYTLWLPKDHTLDFTASASFGHNKYNSLYNETSQPTMTSAVTEDNNSIHGNARYYKSWQNGRMLSASLTHDHNHYKDIYAGTSTGDQRLTTDVTMGLLQLMGHFPDESQKIFPWNLLSFRKCSLIELFYLFVSIGCCYLSCCHSLKSIPALCACAICWFLGML